MGINLFHCLKDWLYTGDLRVWVRQYERNAGGGDSGLTPLNVSF